MLYFAIGRRWMKISNISENFGILLYCIPGQYDDFFVYLLKKNVSKIARSRKTNKRPFEILLESKVSLKN